MSKLSIISLNIKGLTDPVRPKMVNRWLHSLHRLPDILCLQEVKIGGTPLEFNLNLVSNCFKWFFTNHQDGTGGAVIGIAKTLAHTISGISSGITNQGCKISMGNPYNLSVISVYASNNSLVRKFCWEELSHNQGHVILIGDFNMVTSIKDRWECKGNILNGTEKHAWNDLCSMYDLSDISKNSETIYKLKPCTSPGFDGLPNEFFMMLCDFLTPCILLVWEEASSKGFPLPHQHRGY
ncbi:hypothetical protein KP509_20G088500 [Ceratopteris richardii]|uniref:Endonuclease/exonuclease/phosphatase domain-containing protein n=1 Tax=Ceratopteris richardii TaxID=49495 RepID=A0A8T2SJ21_CERRI|nr:hypothetical protein KP509_20G088500 [Ceratopteris richardii]